MTRAIRLALVSVFALTLTACKLDDTRESASPIEIDFLNDARQIKPGIPANDATLLATGWEVCDALRRGDSAREVYRNMMETFSDPDVVPPFLDAAVSNLCREQRDALTEQRNR